MSISIFYAFGTLVGGLGGPALFLLGTAVAIYALWGKIAWARLAGATLLCAAWLIVPMATPVVLSWLSTGMLLAVGVWETTRARRQRA